MRNICSLLAVAMVVGCGGGDGKDGRDGAQGPMGVAGPAGTNGQDGDDGEPGADGMNGADGTNGTNGTNGMDGAPGADGGAILQGSGAPGAGLGADGDIYIDTVSRDVYQKSGGTWSVITNLSGGPKGDKGDQGDPGADGDDGAAGASVLTGSGVPGAGLGKVGDVYIDSATGDLYAKDAGGWAKTGSLKGPTGDEGDAGIDVKDTVGGVRWFAFALDDQFDDAPELLTSETYTDISSAASFTFTSAGQHGRLAFQTSGSYLPGGVNWVAFDDLQVTATVSAGVSAVRLYLANGDNVGCWWDSSVAAGPNYSFDLWNPTDCFNDSFDVPDFSLASVTGVQIGIQSNGANSRTLTVTSISLVSN